MQLEIRPELTVEIKPLTSREAERADIIIGDLLGESPTSGALALLTTKVYSLCSVRSINGQYVSPLAGDVAYTSVRDKFSLRDLAKLMKAYSALENIDPAEVKNESSAEASEA